MASTQWLVLGATGQLGCELLRVQPPHDVAVVPVTREQVDLARPQTIESLLSHVRPALVINAAAWTDVDGAEINEAGARAVNAEGVRALAVACHQVGSRLIHVSTDYVFGAEPVVRRPWAEEALVCPRGAYARSKADGERNVLETLPDSGAVVRTAWLYGAQGRNFVATMVARAIAGEWSTVVSDQWGQPTWARDVAHRIMELGVRLLSGDAPAGIYHATNSGQTTWFEFARAIYVLAGADPALVEPQDSCALDRAAPRPQWSVLGHEGWSQAGLSPMRPWEDALREAMPAFLSRFET